MLRCGARAGLGPPLQGACGGTGPSQAVAAFVALVSALQRAWGGPQAPGRLSFGSKANKRALARLSYNIRLCVNRSQARALSGAHLVPLAAAAGSGGAAQRLDRPRCYSQVRQQVPGSIAL